MHSKLLLFISSEKPQCKLILKHVKAIEEDLKCPCKEKGDMLLLDTIYESNCQVNYDALRKHVNVFGLLFLRVSAIMAKMSLADFMSVR